MKRRLEVAFTVLMFLAAIIMVAVPAFSASYLINVMVSTNTTYTQLPIIVAINNTYLAANGYISSTGLDTRVISAGNVAVAHMVADNKLLFASNLTGNTNTTFQYKTGQAALSSFPIIVGYGGNVATTDNATIELGGNFTVLIDGYINTASGANKTLLLKPDGANYAFKLWVSGAGNITAGIANGNVTALASGVTTGVHTVRVLAGPSNLSLYIDDILKQSSALGTNTTADTGQDYVWNENNVMPYINSVKVWVR